MKIDLSLMITAEDKAAARAELRTAAVKAECTRRILSVLDLKTVSNIQGAAITGDLSEAEAAVFAAGRLWVAAMQTRCRALIQDAEIDYPGDDDWPDVPDGVAEMAARY